MRIPLSLPLIAVLFLTIATGSAARADDRVDGEVLVQLRPGTDLRRFDAEYHLRLLAVDTKSLAARLALPPGSDVDAAVGVLANDPRVVNAQPNLVGSTAETDLASARYQLTSTFDGGGGPLAYQGQFAISQVNYHAAAKMSSGAGVTVAILDTGVSRRHRALAMQVVAGWNFVNNTSKTDDAPGGIDSNGNGVPDEGVGHGTMVAGLVNRFAPRAKLLPVKILDSDGRGTLWNVIAGIRYAIAHGARVLNLSVALHDDTSLLGKAIQEATDRGAVVISSAGNANTDRPQFPAANSHVVAVAGLNADNTKAAFSNFGSVVKVDAPAVHIVSTFWDGKYAAWSGTSFAAPMVSAEAALIISRSPRLRWDRVIRLIADTSHSVDNVNPSYAGQLGNSNAGLIDFDAALAALASGATGGGDPGGSGGSGGGTGGGGGGNAGGGTGTGGGTTGDGHGGGSGGGHRGG